MYTYIGQGGTYLAGVPAADLSDEFVAAAGLDPQVLLESGLYARTDPPPPPPPPPSDPAPVAAPEAPEGAV